MGSSRGGSAFDPVVLIILVGLFFAGVGCTADLLGYEPGPSIFDVPPPPKKNSGQGD
jgi:hypothetical protein